LYALAAALIVVHASGAAGVNATLVSGYPVVEALLDHCPEGVEAIVNGVPVGGVPYDAGLEGGDCRVEVDASGLSILRLGPGDNLTLVFHSPQGDAVVVLLVDGAGGGRAQEKPPVEEGPALTEQASEVLEGGDGRGLDSSAGGSMWLAASLALAAAAAAVGVREYGRG